LAGGGPGVIDMTNNKNTIKKIINEQEYFRVELSKTYFKGLQEYSALDGFFKIEVYEYENEITLNFKYGSTLFIYLETNKAFEEYKREHYSQNLPNEGRISQVYNSLEELVEDLDKNKIKKTFISEILSKGHVYSLIPSNIGY
jgi:hypothetical protein